MINTSNEFTHNRSIVNYHGITTNCTWSNITTQPVRVQQYLHRQAVVSPLKQLDIGDMLSASPRIIPSPPPSPGSDWWSCALCTFRNHPDIGFWYVYGDGTEIFTCFSFIFNNNIFKNLQLHFIMNIIIIILVRASASSCVLRLTLITIIKIHELQPCSIVCT